MEPQKAYRARQYGHTIGHTIDEGEVTTLRLGDQPLVRWLGMLMPLSEGWHLTRQEALADACTALVRQIDTLQTQVDAIRSEIMEVAR